MERKTQEVHDLTETILQSLPVPYGADIIEDVFVAIENNREWQQQYLSLSDNLRAWVVNNWIGKYTQQITGMTAIRHVSPKRTTLIKSYSKLAPTATSTAQVTLTDR